MIIIATVIYTLSTHIQTHINPKTLQIIIHYKTLNTVGIEPKHCTRLELNQRPLDFHCSTIKLRMAVLQMLLFIVNFINCVIITSRCYINVIFYIVLYTISDRELYILKSFMFIWYFRKANSAYLHV